MRKLFLLFIFIIFIGCYDDRGGLGDTYNFELSGDCEIVYISFTDIYFQGLDEGAIYSSEGDFDYLCRDSSFKIEKITDEDCTINFNLWVNDVLVVEETNKSQYGEIIIDELCN